MSTITCNLNCICVNPDCLYNHYITYKDRKIVKKFYDDISNKSKDEPNPDKRKKNCTFGQFCDKETCGFRHRLSFANREKLIVSYKFNKICPTAEIKSDVKSSPKNKTAKSNDFSENLYLTLDNDDVEKKDEIKEEKLLKSWADVVSKPTKLNLEISSKWEDMAEDDFYMEF